MEISLDVLFIKIGQLTILLDAAQERISELEARLDISGSLEEKEIGNALQSRRA